MSHVTNTNTHSANVFWIILLFPINPCRCDGIKKDATQKQLAQTFAVLLKVRSWCDFMMKDMAQMTVGKTSHTVTATSQ